MYTPELTVKCYQINIKERNTLLIKFTDALNIVIINTNKLSAITNHI